ncbi:hypothetical protein KIN20_009597 [Parelaphostrongylus tenuis]|uniref:Reverse transcriptase domain-containing protein n=1 Tax=Parelaphostrongylus tenuis TaxID=148309 RepID=A0AAD5QNG0_PARTN|nr:hypothetical protein KIN20_009597 [Parelaphostrongylus tenuis]
MEQENEQIGSRKERRDAVSCGGLIKVSREDERPLCFTLTNLNKAFDTEGTDTVIEAFDSQGVLTLTQCITSHIEAAAEQMKQIECET